MTSLETETASGESPPVEEDDRPRRRRRPGPKAHPFFRFVFPALVACAAVAVFLLWQEGTHAVLDSTDGRNADPVTDPAAPGFLAFASPTPTMLVAHVDADDALVGVTVLARTALDEGGTLVVLSADMLVSPVEGEPVILGPLFDVEGIAGLERIVGEFFGFGFTDESMVIGPEALEQWLTLVEPIPFLLADDLVELDAAGNESVVIELGGREFDAATLAEVFAWRNPTEVDAARFTRQLEIWRAWLGQVARADDVLAATTPFDAQLPPYLRALGLGTADLSLAPLSPFPFDPAHPVYMLAEADLGWPAVKAAEMVPLPIAHRAGARTTVQVLDGTGDPSNRDRMLPVLVAAGAEISVIGNAPAFGVTETTVTYHLPENEAAGRELAEVLGAPVQFDDDPNQPVELTVTIGTDA